MDYHTVSIEFAITHTNIQKKYCHANVYEYVNSQYWDLKFTLEGLCLLIYVCYFTHRVSRLGPGHKIATILCDSGSRYAGKLFNKKWLESKKFLDVIPHEYHKALL